MEHDKINIQVLFSFRNACPKMFKYYQCSSVSQSCQLFETPWTTTHQASLSIINEKDFLKIFSLAITVELIRILRYL